MRNDPDKNERLWDVFEKFILVSGIAAMGARLLLAALIVFLILLLWFLLLIGVL